jgi:hypothetical protein
MWRKICLVLAVILAGGLGIAPAQAVTNNNQPLKLTPGGTAYSQAVVLVQHAKVISVTSDFWNGADVIAWQLLTTDNTSSPSYNWGSAGNICSANSPHGPVDPEDEGYTGPVGFIVNDSTTTPETGSDNKLQKLLSMIQIAQLTGMQITIYGNALSTPPDPYGDCVVTNILYVKLSNTTY